MADEMRCWPPRPILIWSNRLTLSPTSQLLQPRVSFHVTVYCRGLQTLVQSQRPSSAEKIGHLPLVGEIRGHGLFWAVDLVLDKDLRKPCPLEANFPSEVFTSALRRGVNILGNLGHTGTYQVGHVLACPPYIATEEDIEQIANFVKDAIFETSESFCVMALSQWQ
jgi:adenosylmethionine-8-amino-7-oxononanoate aminotransferase